MNVDLMLDENNDVAIANGDLVTGDSLLQEVETIIQLIPGQLKHTPMLGANLVRLMNSPVSKDELRNKVKENLEADGKDYEAIKQNINLRRIT